MQHLEEEAQRLTSLPSSPRAQTAKAPASDQKGGLLTTKLSPPCLPLWLVERERLLSELDAVRSHPLTLVSASAGSGKTTLLSAWASRQENPVAWLSLDALDNDPARFWASVIMALRRCQPTLGEEALALLRSREGPPLSTILTALLNEIVQVDREAILTLDDYHVIEDPAIHEGLLFLLEHLPAPMHLGLVTRTDPEFPLA